METTDIIITGFLGDTIPSDILQLCRSELSLIVCSAKTRELLKLELGQQVDSLCVLFTPINLCCNKINAAMNQGTVVVITSGDPLFYGFGNTLKNRFPQAEINFKPSVSSMQVCFSRFGLPWNNADFISLHGRPLEDLCCKLSKKLLFVFTDQQNSPENISKYLIKTVGEKKQKCYTIYVGEKLGSSNEKLFSGTLKQVSEQKFKQPNCMIIKSNSILRKDYPFQFGLKEKDIQHSRGLITKNEIRAVVLHSLALPEKGVLWDIGSGSGSISIEAARMNPALIVYAIERYDEGIDNITQNKLFFECPNIQIIKGEAPDILKNLPVPDRVFIGGSGGNLEQIVAFLSKIFSGNESVVINAVTEKTCKEIPTILKKHGFSFESSIISVQRSYGKDGNDNLETLNTIHIIRAKK